MNGLFITQIIKCVLGLFCILSLGIAHGISKVSGENYETSISYVPVYKCFCGANEALKDGKCTPATILVPVVHESVDYAVNISKFKEVIIKDLECQKGFTKLEVGDLFLINSTGEFMEFIYNINHQMQYCIEYYFDEDKAIPKGYICAENPKISTCCPSGQLTSADGKCYSKAFLFQPPLEHGWDDYTSVHVDLKCEEGKILRNYPFISFESGSWVWPTGYPVGSSLLWESEFSYQQTTIPRNEYCISVHESEKGEYLYEAKFCVPDPVLNHQKLCKNASCVRKCCAEGFGYHRIKNYCHPTMETFDYTLYNLLTNENRRTNTKVIIGFPLCEGFYIVKVDFDNGSKILPNGTLTSTDGLARSSARYCLDEVIGEKNMSEGPHALVCFPEKEDKCRWRWLAGSLLLGFSCLFYLATLLIYIFVAELRKKLVGKCLISEIASFLIAYLTLIFLQNVRRSEAIYCNFPGTVEHIFILSSFFWLNIMCFDMWTKLRAIRPIEDSSAGSKKFILYSLYGWGTPILIAVTRLIVDHSQSKQGKHAWLITSGIGIDHCFFSADFAAAKWAYLYGPILVLLVMNLAFFIHVAVILHKMHQERKKLICRDSSKTGKNFNDAKEIVRLYLKLFIVMGLSWMLEIIMWVAVSENDCYFWGIDIVNMLQGLAIFIIFVCKKSTIKSIKTSTEEFFSTTNRRYELTPIR